MKKSDIRQMPEYFDRYIKLVEDIELFEAFDESIEQLKSLDVNLLKKIGDGKYAPDKWTIKEIFQHFLDWERILSQRALLFARINNSVAQGVDENILAGNMKTGRRTVEDLIEELKIVRLSTKVLFAGFDDEMLQNEGTSYKSVMSVLAMGFTIVGHQKHHLKIIGERYFPLA
jgi:hypothetical protein